MSKHGYAWATPEQFDRILGLKATRPEDAPTTLLVAITANLVATNAPQLRTITDDAIDQGRITITLDFAQCDYVSTRGFFTLKEIAHKARRHGGALKVKHLSDDLRSLFEITKLTTLIEVER